MLLWAFHIIFSVSEILQIPHHNPSIHPSRANLTHISPTLLIRAQTIDAILVHSPQLRIILPTTPTPQIHRPEQIPRALLLLHPRSRTLARFLERAAQLPAGFRAGEAVDFAVVACADDLGFGCPEEVSEGQELGGDVDYGLRWLFGAGGVDDCEARVVCCECEGVAGGREGNAVHPACGAVEVFAADGVEG